HRPGHSRRHSVTRRGGRNWRSVPSDPDPVPVRRHKYAAAAVGRDEPGGEVGQLVLVAGRWPVGDDEIAVTRSFADLSHVSVGETIKVVSVADEPELKVAGEVIDIDQVRADISAQRAWVRTSAIDRLTAKGSGYYLMNYRFASDPTSAQLSTAVET